MNPIVAEADRAAAAGDVARAICLLEQAGEADGRNGQLWLKLAALRRAAGQPGKALEAVNRALAVSELDFMALTMRASLIEKLSPENAGQAWANALAQRPDIDLPPQLTAVLAQGQSIRDRWIGERLRTSDANADLPHLARLAEVWEKINNAARETETYNLERKPLVFSVFGLLAEATR